MTLSLLGPPQRRNLQGTDCVDSFQAMQQCMVKHPQAFAEYVQMPGENDQTGEALQLLSNDQ